MYFLKQRVATKLLISLALAISFLNFSECKPPVFTGKEKEAIDKLRSSVEKKLTIPHMKSDAYLIKWLKAKKFDHAKAKEALEKTLEWRKSMDADNFPFHDFGPDLKNNYVIDYSTAKDKNGNPIVLVPMGEWNLRRKAIKGNIVTELNPHIDGMEEKAAQLAFNATGDPTSMVLVDFQGFSLRSHACTGCIPFYVTAVIHHESHYPYNLYRVFGINNPRFFEPVLDIMRSVMTESTREAFHMLGYNRAEYSKRIAEFADLEGIPTRFGGNKKSKN